jgi:hypothetical protein
MNRPRNNELIAVFMGAERSQYVWEDGEYAYTMKIPQAWNKYIIPSNMCYDTSWDWLMPVVKKIRPLWCKNQEEAAANMMAAMFDGDIEITYRYVLEFIKWYNLQSK